MTSLSTDSASDVYERPYVSTNGYALFFMGLALLLLGVVLAGAAIKDLLTAPQPSSFIGYGIGGNFEAIHEPVARGLIESFPGGFLFFGIFLCAVAGVFLLNCYTVAPNQAVVFTRFGEYVGTDRTPGLRWAWPWMLGVSTSLKVTNFVCPAIKVNDLRRNPIEIAAAVSFRVKDTARAQFGVENYSEFARVSTETALREIASKHAYDQYGEDSQDQLTLSSNVHEIADLLRSDLQQRLLLAGLEIVDVRLTHLAYAAEVAALMLRQQQADSIINARKKIVFGAVEMVSEAVQKLEKSETPIELSAQSKAALVANLMVVLVGDKDATPVLNLSATDMASVH